MAPGQLQRAPDGDSGRTNLARLLKWRNCLAISCFILVICLSLLILVISTGMVTAATTEAEIQSCQKEKIELKLRVSQVERERGECDSQLQGVRSACVDGWPWYIASITSGIAIVTLLLVIVIRDLQNQCRNLHEDCRAKDKKIGALQDERGTLQERNNDLQKQNGDLQKQIDDLQKQIDDRQSEKRSPENKADKPKSIWSWFRRS